MTTSLAEFNKSSAKFGNFLVKVCHGEKYSWEYEDKKSGQMKPSMKFECQLVGTNAEHYMVGFVKGSSAQVDSAEKNH